MLLLIFSFVMAAMFGGMGLDFLCDFLRDHAQPYDKPVLEPDWDK